MVNGLYLEAVKYLEFIKLCGNIIHRKLNTWLHHFTCSALTDFAKQCA